MQDDKTKSTDAVDKRVIIKVCKVMYEFIKGFGPSGVPSDELYAAFSAALQLQNLDTYEMLVDVLVRSGLVRRESGHRLVAL